MGAGVHELEKLTARQLGQLIDSGISAAVVPFGSVEYHGGHLPLALMRSWPMPSAPR